jgi:hypothetical protein
MEEPFWTARVETLRPWAVVRVMRDRRDVRRRRSGAISDSDWKCVEARQIMKTKRRNLKRRKTSYILFTYAQ